MVACSVNGAGAGGNPWVNENSELNSHGFHKNNSKWVTDLNIKYKSIKLL